jgi:hypothetical protein
MSIDLSSYASVQTAMFCRLVVPDYQTFYFSDYYRPITLNSISYTGIGNLLNITESYSELKINQSEVTLTITGIPNSSITDFLDNKIKGSTIEIVRAFFNPNTGVILNIAGNPTGRFNGLVNNYSINETWDGQQSSNTISLMCTSIVGLVQNKISGRRTNGIDQKALYPTDTSMDRVVSLSNSNFNFGAR